MKRKKRVGALLILLMVSFLTVGSGNCLAYGDTQDQTPPQEESDQSYALTLISDEDSATAATPELEPIYLPYAMGGMLVLALTAGGCIYVRVCQSYQTRIRSVGSKQRSGDHGSWSLRKLREELEQAESEAL